MRRKVILGLLVAMLALVWFGPTTPGVSASTWVPATGAGFCGGDNRACSNVRDAFVWQGGVPCGTDRVNIQFEWRSLTQGASWSARWELQNGGTQPGVILGYSGLSPNGWALLKPGNVAQLQVILPRWTGSQVVAFHITAPTHATARFSVQNIVMWGEVTDDAAECAPATGGPTPTPRPLPTVTPRPSATLPGGGYVPTPSPSPTPVGQTPSPSPSTSPSPTALPFCLNGEESPDPSAQGVFLPCPSPSPSPSAPASTGCNGQFSCVWECTFPNDTGPCDTNTTRGDPDNLSWAAQEGTYRMKVEVIQSGGTFSRFDIAAIPVGGGGAFGGVIGNCNTGLCMDGLDNSPGSGGHDEGNAGGADAVGDIFYREVTVPSSDPGIGQAFFLRVANPFSCCSGATTGIRISLYINPDEDDDGDGYSNQEEAEAGTDPDDPEDHPGGEASPSPSLPNEGAEACPPAVIVGCVPSSVVPGGLSQGIGDQGGLGSPIASVYGDCVPEYPKIGQLPYITFSVHEVPAGSINPLDYFAVIVDYLFHSGDMALNVTRTFYNYLVDLVIPSNCLETAWDHLMGTLEETPPFSWFFDLIEAAQDALGEPTGPVDIPEFVMAGGAAGVYNFDVDPVIDQALGTIAPYRDILLAGIQIVLWAKLLSYLASILGLRSGGGQE